jgi:hypothetical protein
VFDKPFIALFTDFVACVVLYVQALSVTIHQSFHPVFHTKLHQVLLLGVDVQAISGDAHFDTSFQSIYLSELKL